MNWLRENSNRLSFVFAKGGVILLCFLVAALCSSAQSALPRVTSGRLIRIDSFASQFVTPRNVDIWLPEGYSEKRKYAVLYMHDGQMLFDPATTWNGQAWNVDEVAARMQAVDSLQPFIVVGIWNGGATRHADYFPQQPFERMNQAEKDTVQAQLRRAGRAEAFQPQSDAYLNFLVKELMPYIDKRYSVYTDRAHTFTAGSSMGGLISLYALCEYPEVFGGAACLSTHWVGSFTPEHNPIPKAFLRYLEKHLPDPGSHRLYFDCGDQTLDVLYPPIQKQVYALMKKGYSSANWLTRYFPGEDHSEAAWSKRLHIPLYFLLGK